MDRLLMINNVDLTEYVQESRYSVNSVNEYSKWTDANYVVHRNYKKTRVSGEIELVVYFGIEGKMTLGDLLSMIDSSTQNRITTIACYVMNTGEFKSIYCHLDVTVTNRLKADEAGFSIVELKFSEI